MHTSHVTSNQPFPIDSPVLFPLIHLTHTIPVKLLAKEHTCIMTAYEDAVAEARASWLANETVADARWSLRQLHELYNLLIANRDDLVNALVHGQQLPRAD